MRNGFANGVLVGGIVGAVMSMLINHDIDVNKTRKRIMRSGRSMFKKSRRLVTDIAGMIR